MYYISLSPTNFALLHGNKVQLHTQALILKAFVTRQMSKMWIAI